MKDLIELAEERIILFDGAMGTELMKSGYSQESCPELWNISHPEVVRRVYQSYFEAGSDAVLTNSLGANSIKLESYKLQNRCFELNEAAAQLAAEIRPENGYIGGSIGPTGKFIHPQGPCSERDIESAYIDQIKGLASGGVDFFMIETHYDLREALCAVRTARRHSKLPVFVTMTFNKTPRGYFTIMGDSPEKFAAAMERENIPAFGANCTLDSADMVGLARRMSTLTKRPIIIEANAGNPDIDSATGSIKYNQDIEDYVRHIPEILQSGVRIIGGCCGTSPEYIRRMSEIIAARKLSS